MGQATTNTEQQTPVTVPAAEETQAAQASQPKAPAPEPKQPEPDPKEDEEEDEDEGTPRTEFINLEDALKMGQKQLKNKQFGNAAALRNFLVMDLYPILIELADFANWYIGDLNDRIVTLEESDGEGGEGLDPEFAEQLINFIGMSLQVFGLILRAPNVNPELLQTTQLLVAQAPALIARIQEITMVDDDDADDEYDDDEEVEPEEAEPIEVLEPKKQAEARKPAPDASEERDDQPPPPKPSAEAEPAAEPGAEVLAADAVSAPEPAADSEADSEGAEPAEPGVVSEPAEPEAATEPATEPVAAPSADEVTVPPPSSSSEEEAAPEDKEPSDG